MVNMNSISLAVPIHVHTKPRGFGDTSNDHFAKTTKRHFVQSQHSLFIALRHAVVVASSRCAAPERCTGESSLLLAHRWERGARGDARDVGSE